MVMLTPYKKVGTSSVERPLRIGGERREEYVCVCLCLCVCVFCVLGFLL